MTECEQQIEIAKICGWRLRWQNCGGGPLFDKKPKGHCWEVWNDPFGRALDKNFDFVLPPNCLTDLNAMHEAEKVLTTIQRLHFYQNLCDMFDRNPDGSHRYGAVTYWEATHATAAQRAEAFLKTLGKWKEDT
jgi:hypothetical protein